MTTNEVSEATETNKQRFLIAYQALCAAHGWRLGAQAVAISEAGQVVIKPQLVVVKMEDTKEASTTTDESPDSGAKATA